MVDTIFAVSSGTAPAAIAIVRISGLMALAAAKRLCGEIPPPRRAALRALRGADGLLLDRAIVLVFPGPATATGEDLVELHIHGGRATIRAVESALAEFPGLRQAEPGEFTRRALFHGRIDLTGAEGLGELLIAETETQRRAAVSISEGGLRRRIERWNDQLVQAAAQVEAALDFSDEDDVPEDVAAHLSAAIARMCDELAVVSSAPAIERLRDGVRVVIAGPPNSGKSSLINRLADRDVAIVSPQAGTTRDRVEAPIMRAGVAYVLTDTAGLHDATDAVERIGIDRAREAIMASDILLWLDDATPPVDNAVWLHARCDELSRRALPVGPTLAISSISGEGIPALWEILAERAGEIGALPNGIAVNARQRALISDAEIALRDGASQNDMVLLAEAIRVARHAFDALTGRADVESVLDALFGQFCIGK
ncbi:tRNA uridine-5-carboxymethylaminomethyl(34) synthesis GTPase MnmE [Sphingomonas immobilis]|uniref:tRNA modification GTPase MnmE n=1 Tax=Sphingomonas immobilis TaxID=3063997 RepID=A0ABT8ZV24_9SPHN|nr:tRNA uridine-5-carboxymethylaminomethyl(34) synthesis GTPase MnmE [Sphingomonas sp. CA1-15]MDO7841411.1 tRNA uridine-5-carboxymethylaminomethyl(34) synthesis GTPase MnmE [Sphingomonas sp. CA1-15]